MTEIDPILTMHDTCTCTFVYIFFNLCILELYPMIEKQHMLRQHINKAVHIISKITDQFLWSAFASRAHCCL